MVEGIKPTFKTSATGLRLKLERAIRASSPDSCKSDSKLSNDLRHRCCRCHTLLRSTDNVLSQASPVASVKLMHHCEGAILASMY